MSEHSLPENMEQWPANHYDLFGVDHDVGERELRKAYHRLIRQFRPEHAPEQFRKLNEAYESLRGYVRYEEQFRQQEEDTSDEDDDSQWASGPSRQSAAQPVDAVSVLEHKRDELWQLALDGEMTAAAQQFESLCDENPDDEETLLRLYWLQRLTGGAPPLDRMERFLKIRGPSCRIFAIYLLEVERNHAVSRRESSRQLLLATAIEHESTQLAQSAWLQLVRQKQFIRIGHDLDELKPELVYDHPTLWTLIVYQAAEILVLHNVSGKHPLMKRLADEIRECEPMHENEWIESRWSLVRGLTFDADARFDDDEVRDKLIELVKDSMLGEAWEHRHRLERLAEPWVASPAAGLSALDRLRNYSSSAVYSLHRFAEQLLGERYRPRGRNYLEHLSPRLIEFGETQAPQSYRQLREALARFCSTEDVDLDLLIHQLLELEQRGQRFPILDDDVIASLNDDWPLRCLISCVRLFNE